MKIIIDILHPAHVHFFRNAIKILQYEGHKVLVTARKKDVTLDLLKKYKIDYVKISEIGNSKLELGKELIGRTRKLYKIAKKFKPHIMLGVMGPSIAPVGKLLSIPSLVFYATENATLTNRYVYPLCTKFITPKSYKVKLGKKNIQYEGAHELAYLIPKRFKPNPSVLKEVGLKKGETFTIVRLVSWGASHDIGHKGMTKNLKIKAVKEFSKYGKIFISSEKELPPELEEYRLKISPEKLHDLIAFATLVYGESSTLASEAATLGTHGIYLDNDGRGFTDHLEKRYGLVKNFTESRRDQMRSIEYGLEILKDKSSKTKAIKLRDQMLDQTTDVTKMQIELVERFGKKN